MGSNFEGSGDFLDFVDIDRIIPAMSFMPQEGETCVSPEGTILKVIKVTPVPGAEDRYVVCGLRMSKYRSKSGLGSNAPKDAVFMFRLVPVPVCAQVPEVCHAD